MFSSPTPASGSRSAFAANALRSAGLIEKDAKMRDDTVESKAGPSRKNAGAKLRSHKPRAIDAYKTQPAALRTGSTRASTSSLTSRITPGPRESSSKGSGRLLQIKPSRLPVPASRPTRVGVNKLEVWRDFVNRRYNAEAQFLNLERMEGDAELAKHHLLPPGTPGSTVKEAAVLFKLASQLNPEVKTLSMANNNIKTGTFFAHLSRYLPKLQNLSLQDNLLLGWKDIDFLSGRKAKMEHIRELIMIGNPVRENEIKNGRAKHYKDDMARRFPSLTLLDQEAISAISFDAPGPSTSTTEPVKKITASSFPVPMAASFITGVEGSVISNFLMRFFTLFDTSRNELLHAYHVDATFSYSANTSIPARARIQRLHTSKQFPNQTKLEWTQWLTGGNGGSRNLTRLGHGDRGVDKAVKSLHIGQGEVIASLNGLPATQHDVAGAPEKFCLDGFPAVPGQPAYLLTVHGQFLELPVKGVRSFDRSFIIAPSPEGSAAKLNGWEVVILSDQLNIRGYSSHESWAPGPMSLQAGDQADNSTPSLSAQALEQIKADLVAIAINEPQRSLIMQVCQRTGLIVKFAVDCLQNNEWNVDKAVVNFEQVKAQLPADAYLSK